jgi:hypothetical protein
MSLSLDRQRTLLNVIASPLIAVRLHIGVPGPNGTEHPAAETTEKAGVILPELPEGYAGGGRKTNEALEWVEVKAKEIYSHFSVRTGATGTVYMGYGAFNEPIAVEKGDTFRIPAGLLIFNVE